MEVKIDTGYSWLICFSSFWIRVICVGLAMAYGVLMPSIKAHFDCSTVMVASIGSLHLAVMFLFSVPFSLMTEYFGLQKATIFGSLLATVSLIASAYSPIWQIFLVSYGLFAGFGLGMATFTSELCPSLFFEKWLSVANAIVFSGSSIGYLAFAPILSWVLENYGLKMAFLLEAGLTVTAAIAGGLIISQPFAHNQNTDNQMTKQKVVSDMKKVLTNRRFLTHITGYAFAHLVLSNPVLFLPSMLTEQGLTLQEASLAITIIGISNTVGRLLCGLQDLCPQHTIKTLAMAALGSGLCMAFMVPFRGMSLTNTVCGFYGLLSGPIMSLIHAAKLQLLDKEQLSTAIGISETITGITFLAGWYLYGLGIWK